jgi:predicted enzyme related to lactoylglutathione lyase
MIFKNALSWFEIPVNNLDHAQKFYETIFDIRMIPLEMPQIKMRMFPVEDETSIGGAICQRGKFYRPSAKSGPLIYLNGNPDVQNILDKVELAGGKIIIPKTKISEEQGYMAVFLDNEGNRLALHSKPQNVMHNQFLAEA